MRGVRISALILPVVKQASHEVAEVVMSPGVFALNPSKFAPSSEAEEGDGAPLALPHCQRFDNHLLPRYSSPFRRLGSASR